MTKFFAERVESCGAPPPATEIVSGETNAAVPVTTAILRALASWATPPTSLATTASFLLMAAGRSTSTEPSLMPCSAAWCRAKASCSEEWSSALLGMQPTLRQVPPRVGRFSTSATLRPSCAARNAQTYPPGPAPMTMRS